MTMQIERSPNRCLIAILVVVCMLNAPAIANASKFMIGTQDSQPLGPGTDLLESDALGLTLDIRRQTAVSGQSVFFTVRLSNIASEALELVDFDPANRSLTLTLTGEDGRSRAADQMSYRERDGFYIEPPRQPRTTTLGPGLSLTLEGDLMRWFGPLPAGRYKVVAVYESGLQNAASHAATVIVTRERVADASVTPSATLSRGTPVPATWTHRLEKGRYTIFFQLLSPLLPKNVRLGLRTVDVDKPVNARAAAMIHPRCPNGHLVWQDEQHRIVVAQVDLTGEKIFPVQTAQVPAESMLFANALSLTDGSLMVPVLAANRTRLTMLHFSDTRRMDQDSIPLDNLDGRGPLTGFWENESTFHLFQASPDAGRIKWGVFSVSNKHQKSRWQKLPRPDSKGDIIALKAFADDRLPPEILRKLYLQSDEKVAEEAMEKSTGPTVKVWMVFQQKAAPNLTAAVLNTRDGTVGPVVEIDTGGKSGLRVVQSAITRDKGLAMLLSDDKDHLFFAGSRQPHLAPLRAASGEPIGPDRKPCLMAAGKNALEPWVYLRYIDPDAELGYVRLAPKDVPEPEKSDQK